MRDASSDCEEAEDADADFETDVDPDNDGSPLERDVAEIVGAGEVAAGLRVCVSCGVHERVPVMGGDGVTACDPKNDGAEDAESDTLGVDEADADTDALTEGDTDAEGVDDTCDDAERVGARLPLPRAERVEHCVSVLLL